MLKDKQCKTHLLKRKKVSLVCEYSVAVKICLNTFWSLCVVTAAVVLSAAWERQQPRGDASCCCFVALLNMPVICGHGSMIVMELFFLTEMKLFPL